MSKFRLLLLVACLANFVSLVSILPAFASDPGIRWEVENRFRYFTRAADFREIAMVYEKLKTAENPRPSALQLEKALERREKVIRPSSHYGWAARYFKHTCGREPTHTHSSCVMENGDRYLEPLTANLILKADGISAESCEWRIDDTVLEEKSCERAVARNIKYNASHDITLKPSTGAPLSATIALKDFLIVSFGDSFSSGEGNPEQPVSLVQDSFNPYANSDRKSVV